MLKLMIADDEQLIRDSLARLLDWQSLGIQLVGCYKNGLEALDAIVDEAPDIVLTDIAMPGLSGLELIAKMQQIDRQIEFIILSGYREFDFAKQAMELGVMHYLLKPINEQQVLDAVRKVSANYLAKQPQKADEWTDADMGPVERIQAYVRQNLADGELSLKWLAQNLLYMNVDYLSHQFVNETGEKFSTFLNRTRMEKAKELLLRYDADKIYKVAEQVGCGNNPRYFSQVFKKYTGQTPSQFIEQHNNPI